MKYCAEVLEEVFTLHVIMGTFFITAVTQCEWKTLPPPRYAAWFGKFNDFLKADSSRRALCLPLSEEVSRWRMGWHG